MRTILTPLCILIAIVAISVNAQTIGTGTGDHTIAVKNNGTVYTWGFNGSGQLGNGTLTDSNVPVAVSTSGVLSGKTVTKVATGTFHSIALTSEGKVYTWGSNGYGQLGNGGSIFGSSLPTAVVTSGVLSGKTITQVAAGRHHSIALASDGTVYTWGRNNYGQLGNGNNTNSNVPVAVDTSGVLSGKTITQIAAGEYHSIAVASDGTVYAWGYNGDGELGNGNNTDSNVPVAVTTSGVLGSKTITQVAGGFHSIALASDGTVYTWGNNSYGQLGNASITNSNVPVAVNTGGALNGKTITQVAAGDFHSIALGSDGTVYTWGYNNKGQLGNGDNVNNSAPVIVTTSGVLNGKTITQVAAGEVHSIALASDGTVYTWGSNGSGQLGNGNNTDSNVPVAVDQSGMGLLPVELTAFTASVVENKVLLNWQTATEVNNYGFEVERKMSSLGSARDDKWVKVGFVEGNGTTNAPKEYSFTDKNLSSGKYLYRLKQIDRDGKFEYSQEVEVVISHLPAGKAGIPQVFALMQNYPNPFNPSTVIRYQVPVNSHVTLKLYDAIGREIASLVNERQSAGNYAVPFDGKNLSSGVYFYKLQAGGFVQTRKMMLTK